VCSADAEAIAFDSLMVPRFDPPLIYAIRLAMALRELPESCAMRDGRKWKCVPLIVFYGAADWTLAEYAKAETHAHFWLNHRGYGFSQYSLRVIHEIVERYRAKLLADYKLCGLLVRFEAGRAQVKPALKRRRPNVQTEYYYPAADIHNSSGWVTFSRDSDGVANDVKMFEELLDRRANETEMHKFFSENPSILMEARGGIPISHGVRFANPDGWTPDVAVSSILGPVDNQIEMLELKGPAERLLTKGFHPGFTRKVHAAIDQVRDYERYLKDPANRRAILAALGRIPQKPKLAVLIGRDPSDGDGRGILERRREEVDVKVITYDEVFTSQVQQL
jgi:hypothetical protein